MDDKEIRPPKPTNHFQQFLEKFHERDQRQTCTPMKCELYQRIVRELYQGIVCEPIKPLRLSGSIEDELIYVFTITKHDIARYYGVFTKSQQKFAKIMVLIRLKKMSIKYNSNINTPYENMVDEYNQHLPIFVKNYLIEHRKEFEEFSKLSNDEMWKKIAIESDWIKST